MASRCCAAQSQANLVGAPSAMGLHPRQVPAAPPNPSCSQSSSSSPAAPLSPRMCLVRDSGRLFGPLRTHRQRAHSPSVVFVCSRPAARRLLVFLTSSSKLFLSRKGLSLGVLELLFWGKSSLLASVTTNIRSGARTQKVWFVDGRTLCTSQSDVGPVHGQSRPVHKCMIIDETSIH